MPLAALKLETYVRPDFEFGGCNRPHAACGIETAVGCIEGSIEHSCNRPHAACGIETTAIRHFIPDFKHVATDLMPLAALKPTLGLLKTHRMRLQQTSCRLRH